MRKKSDNPFFGKHVTLMGLGLLGGALGDAIYLADHGARLTITDLKTGKELQPSLAKLKKYKGITYVLGKHRLEDFERADFILQPGNVPLDSPYLAEARAHGIPVYVSESLFFKYVDPRVVLVGVTGTRGKSTTTQLIYQILKAHHKKMFLAGNVRGVSTLALLNQVKAGDIVVMELDSWALHGTGEVKRSPHLAVFTNFMPDHQNFYGSAPLTTGQAGMDLYFADKANIFLHQKKGDQLVVGRKLLPLLRKKYSKSGRPNGGGVAGRALVADLVLIPKNWKVRLLGEHNRENIAAAITAARLLDVPERTIKKAVESYRGLPGRLELIKEARGVKYYNDTTATTPEAVLAALSALRPTLAQGGKIVLISGGTDKVLDFSHYVKKVPPEVGALILLKGTATDKILKKLRITCLRKQANYELRTEYRYKNSSLVVVDNMKDAVSWARHYAAKNDVILLSPGAASFGLFKNEFDRGEQFVKNIQRPY